MIEHRTVPLSSTEEAYVGMVLDQYQAFVAQATQIRNERLQVLYTEKGIPDGVSVGTLARTATAPAQLTYAVEVAAPETANDLDNPSPIES